MQRLPEALFGLIHSAPSTMAVSRITVRSSRIFRPIEQVAGAGQPGKILQAGTLSGDNESELWAARVCVVRANKEQQTANRHLTLPLEKLHGALVSLGRRSRLEGTEVPSPAGSRILLPGIEPVLT